jgi:hypothetical protein
MNERIMEVTSNQGRTRWVVARPSSMVKGDVEFYDGSGSDHRAWGYTIDNAKKYKTLDRAVIALERLNAHRAAKETWELSDKCSSFGVIRTTTST